MSTFLDYIQQFNIPFKTVGTHHHATRGWVQVDCPFCSPNSEKFRLGYNESQNRLNCWVCGPHPLIHSLHVLTKVPYEELKQNIQFVRLEKKEQIVNQKVIIPKGVEELQPPHIDYLKKRKFKNISRLQKLWGVKGFTHTNHRYAWRLFIPVWYGGEIVSWLTRSIGKDPSRRYLTAKPEEEKIHHKDLLYGEDYVRNTIIVVEGVFDVWRLGPGTTCTFGTGFTKRQVAKILKYPYRVVCFDNEPEAQKRARQLCNQLEGFPGTTTNVVLETGKDAAEAHRSEIREFRRMFLDMK